MNIFRLYKILVLILLVNIFITEVNAAEKNIDESIKVKPAQKDQKEEPKKNFEEIKDFYSFDPVTNKWSKIKDFETIEILKSDQVKTTSEYLYRNFWAYDYKTKKWYQVDISSKGYLKPPKSIWEKILEGLAIDISVGAGIGPKYMFVGGKNLYVASVGGSNLYFLTTKSGTPISITNKGVVKQYGLAFLELVESVDSDANLPPNITRSEGARFVDQVYNVEVIFPLEVGLNYTFKNKIRIGLDLGLTFSILESFKVDYQDGQKNKTASPIKRNMKYYPKKDKRFFKSIPTLVLDTSFYLGYSVFTWNTLNDIFLDLQAGPSFYISDNSKSKFTFPFNVYKGSVGIRYERRLGSYLRFFTRLGPEFEFGKINSVNIKKMNVDGGLYTSSIRFTIQAGIGSYFGKNDNVEKALKKLRIQDRIKQKDKQKKLALKAQQKRLRQRTKPKPRKER